MSDKKNVPSHLSPYLNPDEQLIWLHKRHSKAGILRWSIIFAWVLQLISAFLVYPVHQDIFIVLRDILFWSISLSLPYLALRLYSYWRKERPDFYAITNQRIIAFILEAFHSYDVSSVGSSKVRSFIYDKALLVYDTDNKPLVFIPGLWNKNAETAHELLLANGENRLEETARNLGLMD